MVETLKKVTLDHKPFKKGEVLRITLEVTRNVPYVSSEWPSRIILWLSRRYHLITSYFTLSGCDTFKVVVFAICDEDFFRYWSRESLLEYVKRIVE